MATRPFSDQASSDISPETARIIAWELDAGDVGEPFDLAGFSDRSIQVVGSLLGTTVTIQGTLVNGPRDSDYATLNDAFGTSLALSTPGLHAIAEAVRWVRPSATSGSASGITVYLLALGR